MQALVGVAPINRLVMREADIDNGTFKSAVSSFAASLQERAAKVAAIQ
jgi:hypothetical protein